MNTLQRAIRRLVDWSSAELDPAWSENGQHLYFSSDRSDAPGIWRVAVDGPPDPERIIGGRDMVPIAEEDGFLYLFRLKNARSTNLRGSIGRLNLSTGKREEMISDCWASNYAVWKGTVLYIQRRPNGEAVAVQFDPITKTSRTLSAIGRDVMNLNVSSDGQWMMFTHRNIRSDLVLVENIGWIAEERRASH